MVCVLNNFYAILARKNVFFLCVLELRERGLSLPVKKTSLNSKIKFFQVSQIFIIQCRFKTVESATRVKKLHIQLECCERLGCTPD